MPEPHRTDRNNESQWSWIQPTWRYLCGLVHSLGSLRSFSFLIPLFLTPWGYCQDKFMAEQQLLSLVERCRIPEIYSFANRKLASYFVCEGEQVWGRWEWVWKGSCVNYVTKEKHPKKETGDSQTIFWVNVWMQDLPGQWRDELRGVKTKGPAVQMDKGRTPIGEITRGELETFRHDWVKKPKKEILMGCC